MSGAGRYADGVYDRNAPGAQSAGEAYVSVSGYSSNEERLVSQALASALSMPAEQLRQMPPQRPLFPPRFGYDDTEPGISDVVQVDRRYPDSSAALSGTSGGYTGSSGPSLGWW